MFKIPTDAPQRYSGELKQASAFFRAHKSSPEEKALIKIIRDEFREDARSILAEDGEQPTEQQVEEYLDYFIKKTTDNGMVKQVLDEYLEQKIAAQMKH